MTKAVYIRFGHLALHSVAVYISATTITPWVAGRAHDWILPLFGKCDVGHMQFLFSHILLFSAGPAAIAGMMNFKYHHKSAPYAWIVPTIVLGYCLWEFPTNVLDDRFVAMYRYFFAGHFAIPKYTTYREMFTNPNIDLIRGLDQLRFVGPFYAGVAYSLSAYLSSRCAVGATAEHTQI